MRGFDGGMRDEHVHAAVKPATASTEPRAVRRYIGLASQPAHYSCKGLQKQRVSRG